MYRTGDVLQVVIKLTVPEGGDEPPTVVLPAESVMPLSDDSDLPAPGTWLPGFRYEREVAGALVRVLGDPEATTVYMNLERSGQEIDILIESPQGVIVGEVKGGDPLREQSLAAGVQHLYAVMQTYPGAKGLLLTPGTLPPSVADRLRSAGLLSSDVGVVRWRGPQDDKRLALLIHALFEQ